MTYIYTDKYNKKFKVTINISNKLEINNALYASLESPTDFDIFKYYPNYLVVIQKDMEFYSFYDMILAQSLIFKYQITSFYDIEKSELFYYLKSLNTNITYEEYVNLIVKILVDNLQFQEPLGVSISNTTSLYKNLYENLKQTYNSINSFKKFNYDNYLYTNNKEKTSMTKSKTKTNSKTKTGQTKKTISKIYTSADFLSKKDKYEYNIINSSFILKIANNLNLVKIFKEFPLSQDCPFMYINSDDSPKLRIYKQFENKDDIKGLIFKKNDELTKSQNLLLKLRFSDTKYIKCSLLNNGEMNIIFNFSINEKVSKSDINQFFNTTLKSFLNTLQVYIDINKSIQLNCKYLAFHFYVKTIMEPFKLIFSIQKHPNFKYLPSEGINNGIKLKYKNLTTILLIQQQNIHNNKNEYNVQVQNFYTPNSIDSFIEELTDLFHYANNNYNDSNKMQFNLIENKYKIMKNIKNKEKINIKILRQNGIINKAINCQKSRQPILAKSTNMGQIKYKGNSYTCPSKTHPYIGITITKDLCCFKKNQENKPLYKQVFKNQDSKIDFANLEKLFKYHILKSNKILEWGRLATVNSTIQKYSKEPLYRIGSLQDYHSFLNTVSLLMKTHMDIKSIDTDLFSSFSSNFKYNVSKAFYKKILQSNEDYKELLNSVNSKENKKYLDYSYIIYPLLLTKNVNFIIISESSNSIKWIYTLLKNPIYVIFQHSSGEYEGIIKSTKKFNFNINDDFIVKVLNTIKFLPNSITSNNLEYNYLSSHSPMHIVTNKNKTKYLYTKKYGLTPCFPLKFISRNKIDTLDNINKYTLDLKTQLKKLACLLSDHPSLNNFIQVDSFCLNPFTNIINSIKLKSGLHIPVIPDKYSKSDLKQINKNAKLVYEYYIPDLDNYIESNTKLQDNRILYITELYYLNELYNQLNYKISINIKDDDVSKLYDVIKNKNKLSDKFKSISLIIEKVTKPLVSISLKMLPFSLNFSLNRNECYPVFCDIKNKIVMNKKYYSLFISKITNSLLNGDYSILTKNIPFEIQDENEYIIREEEQLIINLPNIKKYFI